MAKTANSKNNPSMEGGVNRAIDFSLKKEDLMLLILEGRKENMEEQIAQIQGVSTQLYKDLEEAGRFANLLQDNYAELAQTIKTNLANSQN